LGCRLTGGGSLQLPVREAFAEVSFLYEKSPFAKAFYVIAVQKVRQHLRILGIL